MRPKSSEMQDILNTGRQAAPQARLKVDIDPPFVGLDFLPDASDPSLCEWNGVLYVTFVDVTDGGMKVAIIDKELMKVTSVFRFIKAPNAKRPKLVFEPSTFPGKPDLPHVAYTDTLGSKAMVYREEYDAQGNVVIVFDEIGKGFDCVTVRMGNLVIDFYIDANGIVYSRKQGTYAEKLIEYSSEATVVKSIDVLNLPDGRFAMVFIVEKQDGTSEARIAYSELFGSKEFNESFHAAIDVQAIDLQKTVFYTDDGFTALISINKIELPSNLVYGSETLYAQISAMAVVLASPISMSESFEGQTLATGIRMDSPKWMDETFYASLGVSAISLV